MRRRFCLASLVLVLPSGLLGQGWEEITPAGFTGVVNFRGFEYQNGGYELFMWFSAFEPRAGFKLDESGAWNTISVYDSVLCDSVTMEYAEHELLDVGKSALSRNRTYSLYRRTGCVTGSVVELYVDTTGATSRQRLLSSYPFNNPYGYASMVVSAADSDLVFLRWSPVDTLYVSTDGGETFMSRPDPIPNGGGLGIYTSPFEVNKVFAEDFDDIRLANVLYVSTDVGMTWSLSDGDVVTMDFHPTDSAVIYSTNVTGYDPSYGLVGKTTNGGSSWISVLIADGYYYFYSVEVHKNHPDTVYAGSYETIYYTTDAGASWRIYNNTFTLEPIIGILQIPTSDTLIVVAQDGVFRVYESFVVDVRDDKSSFPEKFALWQNYPNPFNPVTIIKYDLPVAASVTLKVFDVLGNEVHTLVDGFENPGIHQVSLDASSFASGVYFYRLTTGGFTDVKKLVVVK